MTNRSRWLALYALYVLCLASLMIVLDVTIVNVALPSIRQSLGFSETSLARVVNAYRGVLVGSLNRHRIFLVNLPVGALVVALALRLLPAAFAAPERRRLDLGGALAVTAALMLAVYGIVNADSADWTSAQTLGLLAAAVCLLAVFVAIEARVDSPLMPLGLLTRRNLATSNVVGMLWSASMFAWFFLSALYLQLVLHYRPLEVGLAFLPANLIMAVFSLGLSAKVVMRYGVRRPLAAGLVLAAAGLVLFARAPVHGSFLRDVLPSMVPARLRRRARLQPGAAGGDELGRAERVRACVGHRQHRVPDGRGPRLASVASSRTSALRAGGSGALGALAGGYHTAFVVGAAFALAAAAVGTVRLREADAGVVAPATETT